MPRVIVVVIATGDKYTKLYRQYFYPTHLAYCLRHGYELKICGEFLNPGETCYWLTTLQRALICSQPWCESFDYAIHVDADILINARAPTIHDATDYGDKVGIVDDFSQPSPVERAIIQKRNGHEVTATEYYRLAGFEIQTEKVLNTGVMVMQPAKHRKLFRDIYDAAYETAKAHPRRFHYENSIVGYALQIENKAVIIDNKWNAIFGVSNKDLPTFYNENYFIHFAGKTYAGREKQIKRLHGV